MRWAVALALVVLTGCGQTREVRERDLVVRGDASRDVAPEGPRDASGRGDAVRIAVVTHGQASSPFWVVVRNGIDAAARQADVSVSYRSPDTYSVPRMRGLIEEAVASRPDGLVVSIPSAGLDTSIRRAVQAGIPVVSINSGSNRFRELAILAHVGQPEDRAGQVAGERLAGAGVRRALCVNHEPRNAGLGLRCRAFARAIERAGGTAQDLSVDVQDRDGTRRAIAGAVRTRRIDGILTLNSDAAEGALDVARAPRIRIATFDLSATVLAAIKAGRLDFAVDQQAYLQGYLPIVLLTQRIRYGLFAAEGEVVATGPSLVTRKNADQVTSLIDRGIR